MSSAHTEESKRLKLHAATILVGVNSLREDLSDLRRLATVLDTLLAKLVFRVLSSVGVEP